jgi:hypothetical protein
MTNETGDVVSPRIFSYFIPLFIGCVAMKRRVEYLARGVMERGVGWYTGSRAEFSMTKGVVMTFSQY